MEAIGWHPLVCPNHHRPDLAVARAESGDPNAMAQVVRWLGLAFAALAVPAAFLGLREVTYQVDDRGIHVRRAVRRRSFDLSWETIAQVEHPRLSAFPSRLVGYSAPRMETHGLRTEQ